jgi:hypothetical protein
MEGCPELPSPCVPSSASDTREVVPATRSRTKTSSFPLVSPGTRFAAKLSNATYRPVLPTAGAPEKSSPCVPSPATDTRSVVPVARSLTKTSWASLVSPGTRFGAKLSNATYRPVPLMAGDSESWNSSVPSLATDTLCVLQSTSRPKFTVVVLPSLIFTFDTVFEIQPWLLAVIVSGLTFFDAQKA